MRQPNQSDHTDYSIMLARAISSKLGASPLAIQLNVEALNAIGWIEEARPISEEQWLDLKPRYGTTQDTKYGYFTREDLLQEIERLRGELARANQPSTPIVDRIDFPDPVTGKIDTYKWDPIAECWRKVYPSPPFPILTPTGPDTLTLINADGTRNYYQWNMEHWNEVKP